MINIKSQKCSTWMQSQKQQNDLCSFPRKTIQYHSNPSLCTNQYAKEAEGDWFYEDLQHLLELTLKKYVLFIIGDWNAKEGSQEISGVTGNLALEYGMKQGKGYRVLARECTGHSKYSLPTTQEKTLHMDITRWPTLKSG